MALKKSTPKTPDPPAEDDGDAAAEPAPRATPDKGARFVLTLSPAATRMLDTAALVEGKDRAAVIDSLIRFHLAGYYAGKREEADERSGR